MHRFIDGVKSVYSFPLFEPLEWSILEQAYLRISCAPEDETATKSGVASPVLDIFVDTDFEAAAAESPATTLLGWAECELEVIPGLAHEHKRLIHESRSLHSAFDTFLALADAGERQRAATCFQDPPADEQHEHAPAAEDASRGEGADGAQTRTSPRYEDCTLASESLDAVSPSSSISGAQQAQIAPQSDAARSKSIVKPPESSASSLRGSSRPSYDDLTEQRGITKRERRQELHRAERGLAQFKAFRTASWIRDKLLDGKAGLKRRVIGQLQRKMKAIESEEISHF